MRYDAAKHIVRSSEQLDAELTALHENARVAWDRDAVLPLNPETLIIGPVAKLKEGTIAQQWTLAESTLAFAADGRRIYRLVVDPSDALGIRWIRVDRKEGVVAAIDVDPASRFFGVDGIAPDLLVDPEGSDAPT